MGFIHYNNTVEEQVQHVKRAKNHTPGFVVEPAVMGKDRTVLDLFDLKERKGYGSVCVTDTGEMGGKLLGVVSSRDYDFVTDGMTTLDEIMTTDVVTITAGSAASPAEINTIALEKLKSQKFGACFDRSSLTDDSSPVCQQSGPLVDRQPAILTHWVCSPITDRNRQESSQSLTERATSLPWRQGPCSRRALAPQRRVRPLSHLTDGFWSAPPLERGLRTGKGRECVLFVTLRSLRLFSVTMVTPGHSRSPAFSHPHARAPTGSRRSAMRGMWTSWFSTLLRATLSIRSRWFST